MKSDVNRTDYNVNTIKMMLDKLRASVFIPSMSHIILMVITNRKIGQSSEKNQIMERKVARFAK